MYRPKGTEKSEAGDHLVFTSGSQCSMDEYVLSNPVSGNYIHHLFLPAYWSGLEDMR